VSSRDVTSGQAVRDAAEQAAHVARDQATQAAHVAAQVAPERATHAAVLARSAAERAAPRVGAAVEWASPRIEKGLLAAGPAFEAAAERMVPAVDAARDRLVEELLPRIVEAVNAASAAGVSAQRAAAERVSTSLETAAHAVPPMPPPSHRGRRLIIFGTLAAAGAAGVAAWRRSRSSAPDWDALDADEPAFTGGPEPTPSSLSEPTGTASVAETVTEEPLGSAAPEPPTTGDPVLDGLGTAEKASATGTSGPVAEEPGAAEVVEVVEVIDVPEGADTTGEATSTEEVTGSLGDSTSDSIGDTDTSEGSSTGRGRKS